MTDLVLTSSYDYALPDELIAATPSERRTDSRLLVLRANGVRQDETFAALPNHLRRGDVLVVNDAKVTPVRCSASRATGGAVEVFVLGLGEPGRWDDPDAPVIAFSRSNKRLSLGEVLRTSGGTLTYVEERDDDTRVFRWNGEQPVTAWIDNSGTMPLPPYIVKRRKALGIPETSHEDTERYQTVFASASGAVAAPTAGLHFDHALLDQLRAQGVEIVHVTLQVGAGTFKPVACERLDEHGIHGELVHVPEHSAARINAAKSEGRRVVAVGTTVVRTLESAWCEGAVRAGAWETRLFIMPGFTFRVVDLLVTNFHLPKSTLLALVSAFAGHARVMSAYAHAVDAGYRFYSYGDCMLLERVVDE